jgi:hypothetical protein
VSNLVPRRPDYNAPSKSSRAQRIPGTVLRRIRQEHGEQMSQAIARAQREKWWPHVVHRAPVLSCGLWVWQARA